MSQLRCGQIWLVNFDPSIGHEYNKMRPALIVQNDRFITDDALVTLIPLSSQLHKTFSLDVFIAKDEQNRLMTDSLVKTNQLSTFDQRRLVKLIGNVDSAILKKVKKNIKAFVG